MSKHATQTGSKRAGQFYRDVVNGDLLKIINFSINTQVGPEVLIVPGELSTILPRMRRPDGNAEVKHVEYVRCACIVAGRLFGVQEMRAMQLDTGRFKRVWLGAELWYRVRYRNSKLTVPLRDPNAPASGGFGNQKSTY